MPPRSDRRHTSRVADHSHSAPRIESLEGTALDNYNTGRNDEISGYDVRAHAMAVYDVTQEKSLQMRQPYQARNSNENCSI